MALIDHGGEVLLHGVLGERVDVRGLSDAAGSDDLLGDGIGLRRVAAGQEEPCPLAREGSGDGAADRASGSIDHGGLVFEQHVRSDTGGDENATAGPFPDEPVSLS
jgi:hypothetical protein